VTPTQQGAGTEDSVYYELGSGPQYSPYSVTGTAPLSRSGQLTGAQLRALHPALIRGH